MKVVFKKTERYVVRCNDGYLANGQEVACIEDARKFEQRNHAEKAIEKHRIKGWDALWIEELPRPFRVVLS